MWSPRDQVDQSYIRRYTSVHFNSIEKIPLQRETDTEKETDRYTERERKKRETEIETEMGRYRKRETNRQTDRQRQKYRKGQREKETERDTYRKRDRHGFKVCFTCICFQILFSRTETGRENSAVMLLFLFGAHIDVAG